MCIYIYIYIYMAASRLFGYRSLKGAGPGFQRSSIHLGGRSGPGLARNESILRSSGRLSQFSWGLGSGLWYARASHSGEKAIKVL